MGHVQNIPVNEQYLKYINKRKKKKKNTDVDKNFDVIIKNDHINDRNAQSRQ